MKEVSLFYSDDLKEYYNSKEECEKAEAEYAKKKAEEELTKANISKEKKEYALAVEKSEKDLTLAYSNLEVAKEKADSIIREARDEAGLIIDEAWKGVKSAEQKRFESLSAFNKKFGPYTTTYSGERAIEEYHRATSWLSDIINYFF